MQNYGCIATPLSNLLNKGAYEWNGAAQHAFDTLKQAMVTLPVLAIPNFSQPFELNLMHLAWVSVPF